MSDPDASNTPMREISGGWSGGSSRPNNPKLSDTGTFLEGLVSLCGNCSVSVRDQTLHPPRPRPDNSEVYDSGTNPPRTAVAIVSGGMDSVTLAYLLHSEGYDPHLLSIDYGQRHVKELQYARLCAERLGARFDVADLTGVGRMLKGSALTDDIPVPHGHYAASNMAVTVVPNRNAIMLSVAYGVAVAEGARVVAVGVHAGDHFIYPDCRPEFITTFDAMQKVAVKGFGHPDLCLYAPFVNFGKHDIVTIGARLGVPYADTWSCYEGGDEHCGLCGTCGERKEAFQLAGVTDPTAYAA